MTFVAFHSDVIMKTGRENKKTDEVGNVLQDSTGIVHGTCDFLKDPLPECYCKNLSSRNVPRIIRFCASDFRQCLVYLKINKSMQR